MQIFFFLALSIVVLLAVLMCVHNIMKKTCNPCYRWSMASAYAVFTAAYHMVFWNTYQGDDFAGILAFVPIFAGMPGSFLGCVCDGLQSKLVASGATGTLQWFCIGWAVDALVMKARKRGNTLP